MKAGLDIDLLGCLVAFQGGDMVDRTFAHPAPNEDVIISYHAILVCCFMTLVTEVRLWINLGQVEGIRVVARASSDERDVDPEKIAQSQLCLEVFSRSQVAIQVWLDGGHPPAFASRLMRTKQWLEI